MNIDENIQHRRGNTNSNDQDRGQQSSSIPILPPSVASSIGNYVFTAGKERAQQALNIYSHIDYLRPYFDVEPKDVLNRLIYSVVPIQSQQNNRLPTELYGPLMIVFTLCAIIIYQMKMANHAIQDGTLIGTAFFVCFTYWIGTSFLLSSTSFLCNSSITFFNYLSLVGYSLFSHCIVLFIGTFIHTAYDHYIFYILWLGLGGAAGLKLAYIVFNNTPNQKYKLPLTICVILMHMLFLLYVHFVYHELAEEVSHALFDKAANEPASLNEVVNAVTKQIKEVKIDQPPYAKDRL